MMLSASVCDGSHCNVCDESQCKWYFCPERSMCEGQNMVAVSKSFDAVHSLEVTSAAGGTCASAGAGIAALFGPEAVPIGAVIGGIVGALAGSSAVAYQIYGEFSCLDAQD